MELETILMRLSEKFASLRTDSGLQLDLEIALSGVPAKVQPHGLSQSGRKCVETSGDVTENAFMASARVCRALSSIITVG